MTFRRLYYWPSYLIRYSLATWTFRVSVKGCQNFPDCKGAKASLSESRPHDVVPGNFENQKVRVGDCRLNHVVQGGGVHFHVLEEELVNATVSF